MALATRTETRQVERRITVCDFCGTEHAAGATVGGPEFQPHRGTPTAITVPFAKVNGGADTLDLCLDPCARKTARLLRRMTLAEKEA